MIADCRSRQRWSGRSTLSLQRLSETVLRQREEGVYLSPRLRVQHALRYGPSSHPRGTWDLSLGFCFWPLPQSIQVPICAEFGMAAPLAAGQAIEGDIGAEVKSEFWAKTTTEAAVKSSTERKVESFFSSLAQHAQFITKKSSPGQRLARLLAHNQVHHPSTYPSGITLSVVEH